LTYKRNNAEPRIEPCGTPEVTDRGFDVAPNTVTRCLRFVRNKRNHLSRLPQESNHPNIHNKEEVRNEKKGGEKKGNPSQQHRSPSPSNSTSLKNAVENNNPVTIIIGDSMIKVLRPDKISKSVKHKVQVNPFLVQQLKI
jgi:hypothetical protein